MIFKFIFRRKANARRINTHNLEKWVLCPLYWRAREGQAKYIFPHFTLIFFFFFAPKRDLRTFRMLYFRYITEHSNQFSLHLSNLIGLIRIHYYFNLHSSPYTCENKIKCHPMQFNEIHRFLQSF